MALSTKSYRIWLPNDNIVETINVTFKDEVEPKREHRGAMMGPSSSDVNLNEPDDELLNIDNNLNDRNTPVRSNK